MIENSKKEVCMSDYYRCIAVGDGIYRFTSVENVFFELLVGEEKALLIDTGYGFGDVKGAVREITDKPLMIVNTHGHVDHTCGNYQFEEDIYISEADMDLLRRHNARTFREKSIRLAQRVVDWESGQEVYGLPRQFDEAAYLDGGIGSHILPLHEGMCFDLGGKHLRAFATPGHTKGSMSLLYEEKRILYVGDAANPFLWLFDRDATDRKTLIRSLDRMADLQPELVYGGHGPVPFSTEDLKMFRKAAVEADYEHGIPFSTPLMEECKDIRVCILNGKTMADIGTPGFYAILIDASRTHL